MSAERKTRKLDQVTFFKVCDAARTHKDQIEKECHRDRDMVAFLMEKTGTPSLSTGTIATIREALGITLKTKNTSQEGSPSKQASYDKTTIVKEIARIVGAMGDTLSDRFKELLERVEVRGGINPALKSVPVKGTVVDPRNIPIINK